MEETITEGIRVQVESFYLDANSKTEENLYVFAYHIRLKNLSKRTVQLMSRHWIITDSSGEINEVKGDGVVGDQPVLAPDEEYEYTSGSISGLLSEQCMGHTKCHQQMEANST